MKKLKTSLDEILAQYEVENKTEETQESTWTESDYELWEYLCGNGNIQHLYNHYELN